jgi:porin
MYALCIQLVVTPSSVHADHAEAFGGPGSIGSGAAAEREVHPGPGTALPIEAAKQRMKRAYGVDLDADYNILLQHASESLGDDNAAAGALRLYGRWTPFARAGTDTGSLVFKVEHRHRLGTDNSPQELGPLNGYIGLTTVPFSEKDWVLNHLYWTQSFFDNRFGFNVGIVDVTDYLNVYALVNSWTDFNNLSFSTSATIPAPDNGLGAVGRWSITPNLYAVAGLADANGDPRDPGNALESFFNVAEYFKHFELGWIGSWKDRYTDNAHVSIWQVDRRDAAGVPEGWGAALSWSWRFYECWVPFFRAGYSDGGGAFLEQELSAGLGYQVNNQDDFIGFGGSWGRPPTVSTVVQDNNQFTFEAYYRFHVRPHLEITPSIQYILNPAANPSADSLWVPSLRLRAKL